MPLTGVEFRLDDRLLTPQEDQVSPETTVHWDSPASPMASRILLQFTNSERNESGSAIGINYVRCNIEHNGKFQLPVTTHDDRDDSYLMYSLTRPQERTEQRGDILIFLQSESQRVYFSNN